MVALNPAILDTLAFAGMDEAQMRKRALSSRENCGLYEHPLSFIRYRRHTSGGHKPLMVILPDGPATLESYDDFLEKVEDRFDVIIMEIPGFGFSFPKSPEALDFEKSVEILNLAVKELADSEVILVGPCVQGLLGARMTECAPELFAGLIICQTGDFPAAQKWSGEKLDPTGLLKKPFVGQVAFRMGREQSTIDWWVPFSAGPELDLPRFQEEARKVQRAQCCYALPSQVQAWLGRENLSITVHVPTAVIWGLSDKSHEDTDRMSILSYAPNAQYTEVENLGHFLDLEDPELIARTAMELLEAK